MRFNRSRSSRNVNVWIDQTFITYDFLLFLLINIYFLWSQIIGYLALFPSISVAKSKTTPTIVWAPDRGELPEFNQSQSYQAKSWLLSTENSWNQLTDYSQIFVTSCLVEKTVWS